MKSVKYWSLLAMFIVFTDCSTVVTEEDLIGGKWVSTAEFDGRDAVGESGCHPFDKEIEFKKMELYM